MKPENTIQEMQIIEQNMQNIFFQKQAFQMELSETDSALNEVQKAGDEVFKIVGQLMIKADKSRIEEELENKKKLLDLRLKSLNKQEKVFSEKIEELQKEVMNKKK